jgi:hypothetical protein
MTIVDGASSGDLQYKIVSVTIETTGLDVLNGSIE